jgi:PAS domain S-box-containing protein
LIERWIAAGSEIFGVLLIVALLRRYAGSSHPTLTLKGALCWFGLVALAAPVLAATVNWVALWGIGAPLPGAAGLLAQMLGAAAVLAIAANQLLPAPEAKAPYPRSVLAWLIFFGWAGAWLAALLPAGVLGAMLIGLLALMGLGMAAVHVAVAAALAVLVAMLPSPPHGAEEQIWVSLWLACLAGLGAAALRRELSASRAHSNSVDAENSLLRTLGDMWYWEQDASHRFIAVRGGHGVSSPLWDQLLGRRLWELADIHADSSVWEKHRTALQGRTAFSDVEFFVSDGTSQRRSVLRLSGVPIVDPQRGLLGYRGIGCLTTDAPGRVGRGNDAVAWGELLDRLPTAAVLICGENVSMNRAAERMTEYPYNDLRSTNQWFSLLFGQRGSGLRAALHDGRLPSDPLQLRSQSGRLHHVKLSAQQLGDHELLMLHDVSPLLAAEGRFRALFDQAAEACVLLCDGVIVDCNGATLRLLGHSDSAALIGQPPHNFAPPHQPDGALSAISISQVLNAAQRGTAARTELLLRRTDGSTVLVAARFSAAQIDGQVLVMGVWRDLTAQQRQQDEQARQTRLLDYVTNAMPGVVFQYRLLDDGTPVVPFISRGVEAMLGLKPAQIYADCLAFLAPIVLEDRPRFLASVQQAGHSAIGWDIEFRVQHGGAPVRWIHGRSTPVTDEQGNAVFNGVLTDITERKAAEDARRDSEVRLRALMALAYDYWFETDAELRITHVTIPNPEPDRIGMAQYIGRRGWEVPFAGEFNAVWGEHVRRTAARQPYRDQVVRRPRSDGSVRVVSSSGEPLFDASGQFTGYIGVAHDITDQILTQEALIDSEQRFALALHGAGAVLWDWNVPADQLDMAPRLAEMLKLAAASSTSLKVLDACLHPDDRERWMRVLRGHLRDRSPLDVEVRVRGGGGEWRWLRVGGQALWNAAGRATRVIGSAIDITEERRAVDQLRMSEARLSMVLDNMPVVYVALNEQGAVSEWNREAERATGYTRDEAVGDRAVFERLFIDDATRQQVFDLASDGGRDFREIELTHCCRDGQERTMAWSSIARRVPIPGFANWLVAVDITERKAAEVAVQRINASLQKRVQQSAVELSASTRELEQLSYSAAHDLRAPLRCIDGFSQILVDDFGSNMGNTATDYLRRVRASVRRLNTMLDDQILMTRVAHIPLRRSALRLDDIARRELVRLHTNQPEREVNSEITGELRVEADAELVGLLLKHLIGNAWTFSASRRPAVIRVGAEAESFFVQDNGQGIDMSYAGKIFAPFQKLDPDAPGDGNGVGLALAERIVQRHGGRIWVESAPGAGATFFFSLQAQS